ncbi:MAG: hypothetical protein RL266_1382 [Bacteroidota bacterium]
MNDLKVLGTIARSHGLKGAFKVNAESAGFPELKKDEPVFILLQGGPVPFFVEECTLNGYDKLVLKLEDVDTLEKAESFIGKTILLEREMFVAPEADATEELIGFSVIDAEKGNIGVVSGFLETRQHPVLEVDFDGTAILIPWVEEIIRKVEVEKKLITIEAPDGLIDLYING